MFFYLSYDKKFLISVLKEIKLIIPKFWAEEKVTKKIGGSQEDRVNRFKKVYSKQHLDKPNFESSEPKEILSYAQKLIEGVSEIKEAIKASKSPSDGFNSFRYCSVDGVSHSLFIKHLLVGNQLFSSKEVLFIIC